MADEADPNQLSVEAAAGALDHLSRNIDKATLATLLAIGRQIWGARPVGLDSTANLPGVLVRTMKTVGDLAAIARQFGSVHWEVIDGETPLRIEARNEVKKELGNLILSTIRFADDLGLDVGDCVVRAIVAQMKYAQSGARR